MHKFNGHDIELTRGDSLVFRISLSGRDLPEGSVGLFTVKANPRDERPVIEKRVDASGEMLMISLAPKDTDLTPRTYFWDVRVLIPLENGGYELETPMEYASFVILEAIGRDFGVPEDPGMDGDLPVLRLLIEEGRQAIRDLENAKTRFTPAVDHTAFGIAHLALTGDIAGMSQHNAVTLHYTYGERSGTLSCRWQGSSSLQFPKKNYTVEFDTAFEAKTGWGAQKKYCLKAHWTDASYLRNQLGAVLWGQMVKSRSFAPAQLAALPNGGAIDGFPVWVTLNGEPLGLYMFNIPKEPWLFGMTGANANEAILCSETYDFFKSAACDGMDVKIEYTANPDPSPTIASFNAMVSAVNNVRSADDLSALDAVLDIESAVDYYVLVSALCHDDGISRNTLFTTFDGTKWIISAYDMDACFGNAPDGSGYGWANDYPMFTNIDTAQKLFQVLRTYYADWIKSRFQGLRYWVLGNLNIQAEAYGIAAQIPKVLLDEDFRLWPDRPGTLTNNIHQILEYNRERMANLDYNVTLM